MDVIERDRRAITRNAMKLSGIVGAVDPLIPPTEAEVDLHLKEARRIEQQCQQWVVDLTRTAPTDAEFNAQEVLLVPSEEKIAEAIIKLSTIKASMTSSSSTSAATTTTGATSTSDIRLPKLDLPSFSGNIHEWLSFHDLFIAAVHNNSKITEAQKLQFLKTCVKGEALLLIQSITITNANYTLAWDTLKNRYENKRELVKSLFDRLLSQPILQQESPMALRKMVDTTSECVRGLEILKLTREQICELLFIHMLIKKLDSESRLQWERSLKDGELPTFKQFQEFLDRHARTTAAAKGTSSKPKPPANTGSPSKPSPSVHYNTTDFTTSKCGICEQNHPSYKCSKFNSMQLNEKWNVVKQKRLCINCLRGDHFSSVCPSPKTCFKCKEKHHTLLHHDKQQSTTRISGSPEERSADQVTHPHSSSNVNSMIVSNTPIIPRVLLSTALVQIRDSTGNLQWCRALLDNGSEASIISEHCINRLGLRRQRVDIPMSGLGGVEVGSARGLAKCTITSPKVPNFILDVNVLIRSKVTRPLPQISIDSNLWPHITYLDLADPTFYKSGFIDILLGGDVYAQLLRPGICHGPQGTPSAIETVFGWVLLGKASAPPPRPQSTVSINHAECNLDSVLRRFWELEELPDSVKLSTEEQACENHFHSTHSRDSTGRFVVQLPFRENSPALGNSKGIAITRMQQLERRLARNPTHRQEYTDFMDEYLRLGHMEVIPEEERDKPESEVCYLPHHFVLKESTTTQLRAVFNGSSKTSTGVTLNEKLMVGPTIQNDLMNIMLRFRTHPVALTADIAKMYRQVLVTPEHADFQRIIWRNSPSEPMEEFRLKTVTYGTASAPYLATKCLQQLAMENKYQYPAASEILARDFYVDDCITGASDINSALQLQSDLFYLLRLGGFQLRKWTSNKPELVEFLPDELKNIQNSAVKVFDQDEITKTLGIQWHPTSDVFSFSIVSPPVRDVLTKRSVLSDLAKTFDPLGWLSPVVIRAKIFFQSLWSSKLSWDDSLPAHLIADWSNYIQDLEELRQIKIPRCIVPSSNSRFQLHGFCDASEKAYAAVLYLFSQDENGHVQCQMITAKTRVAPVKQVSLPRLELCAAVLLIKLLEIVQKSLLLTYEKIVCWSDSTIVLSWLSSSPQRWKTFVANRVAEVQRFTTPDQWHHVRSEVNPADCASRGISPLDLKSHFLWWNGPPWLINLQLSPLSLSVEDPAAAVEEKVSFTCHAVILDEWIQPTLKKYSTLTKLLRVIGYCLRFYKNLRLPRTERDRSPLSADELDRALTGLIWSVQHQTFQLEFNAFRKKRESIPKTSKLKNLNPILDAKELLRVGGRIHKSNLPEERKHPIILPRHNPLTKLIVEHEHRRLLHAGPQLLLSSLQTRYWILWGKDAVRHVVRNCVKCHRFRNAMNYQRMGNLPAARVTPSSPFVKTGVDYAGPFMLKLGTGRAQKQIKHYIVLFVCLATRAIHLECASDMTTDTFLAAFKWFVSHRGKPTDMFSDCGSNFIGADKELKTLLDLTNSQKFNFEISDAMAIEGIRWHFNPPAAPHFGGIWEAGVKSVKFHLRRVIGDVRLTYEEFITILSQVEACLNSRPLTADSTNSDDLAALTPGHFLIGRSLMSVPEPSYSHLKQNHLSRWQLTQQLLQHFWKRWAAEYLTRLQQRNKWTESENNIKLNTIVLVKDENLPPSQWKLGRIVEVHPGQDNLVRAVTVRTQSGLYKRPITKLSPLPIEESHDTL